MARPVDPNWEAVMDAFSLRGVALNSNERGKVNKAIKLWKESEGTPEEWKVYVGWYKRIWPNVVTTPIAVVSNRSLLRLEAQKAGLIRRPEAPRAPSEAPAPLPPRSNPVAARAHLAPLLARMKGGSS